MAKIISQATKVSAAGNKPKIIEEYVGLVNTGTSELSVARMRSPAGWVEPGQTPDFDEYTIVLSGMLQVETKQGVHQVNAGQAIIVSKNEWVRYSTPGDEGAEYIAICQPAFAPGIVHRDAG